VSFCSGVWGCEWFVVATGVVDDRLAEVADVDGGVTDDFIWMRDVRMFSFLLVP
jgi:hypothetical protein